MLNDSSSGLGRVGGLDAHTTSPRRDRWARAGAVLLSIVALLSAWATYKQFAVGLTAVTLPALLLLFVMLLAMVFRKVRVRMAAADLCVLLYYLLILVSLVWSKAQDAWLPYAYWYTICIIIYFSVRFFAYSSVNLKIIIYGAAVGIVISGVLATNQVDEWGITNKRQSIEGVNSNFTAYVLAGSIYLLAISRRYRILKGKWIQLVMALLLLFGALKIFDLGTRGAIISIVAMACWRLVFPVFPKSGVLPLVLLALIVSALTSLGILDPLLRLLENLWLRNTSDLSGRLELWPIARSMLTSFYMFTGIGAGAFAVINPLGIGAHNLFLSILLDAGVFGLCLFFLFILGLFRPALVRGASRDSRYVFGMFTCFWLPIALTGVWEVTPFSWLLLGFTYNVLRLEKHDQK